MKIGIYQNKYTPIGFNEALQNKTGCNPDQVQIITDPRPDEPLDMVIIFENHKGITPEVPTYHVHGSRQQGYMRRKKGSSTNPSFATPINYDNAVEELGIIIKKEIGLHN